MLVKGIVLDMSGQFHMQVNLLPQLYKGGFFMLKQQILLKPQAPTAFLIPESRKASRTLPPKITWEVPAPDFDIPDEPMDNFDQSLLAEALRDALSCAQRLSNNELCATSLALCVKVDGKTITKAPDWFYVPDVIPTEKNRKSYTPIAEGNLPSIVMEFLSDKKGNEYNKSDMPPYGKWYFYEKILKIPWYIIFDSSSGQLEVYHLEKGIYKKQTSSENGCYWIDSVELFLGVWFGENENLRRKTFWLRWWDAEGNCIPWQYEKAEREKQHALEQAEKAEREKQHALEQAEKVANEKILTIAKKMLQADTDIAFIAEVTGLDEAEISKLNRSL
jgi:Uma2 family endonuclease